jgi:hypothetical protein
MSSSEKWLPFHKAVCVYSNRGTYNKPALALSRSERVRCRWLSTELGSSDQDPDFPHH